MRALPQRRCLVGVAAALGCVFALGLQVGIAWADERVLIEVGCILASEGDRHVDRQLEVLRWRLEKTFNYPSYRLVKRENRGARWGDPVRFDVPGEHSLRIRPLERRADRVALNLALTQNDEVLVETDVLLGRHGRMILGGPRLEDGVLLIWIEARTKQVSRLDSIAGEVASPSAK